MGRTIFRKMIDGIECEAVFDDIEYSPEESRKLIAEFLYVFTSFEEN